jgi:hypothetical protein
MEVSIGMSLYEPDFKRIAIIGGLVLLILASVAYADVSCSITIRNSDGYTKDSVDVSNAVFKSVSVLNPSDGFGGLPYSILSKGAGRSTSSSGKFSESVEVGGGPKPGNMNSNVQTQSGEFAWSKSVNIGSTSPTTLMQVSSMVSNGILDSSYSNSNSVADKEIYTKNSKYFDKTSITPQSLDTLGDGESTDEIGNSFLSILSGKTLDKKAVMNTDLSERWDKGADNKWTDRIFLTPKNGYMFQSATVLSNNKCRLWEDQLGTVGQIQVGMKFTPYDAKTGSKIFETQKVPSGIYPLSILVIPRETQNEPSYFDFKTISMLSIWPN